MAVTLATQLPILEIEAFCKRWNVTEFAVFGSVLRDDFRPDSDIDVLYTQSPDSDMGLLELSRMRHELMELFGRDVDLVCKETLKRNHNSIRRRNIIGSAQVLYAAG